MLRRLLLLIISLSSSAALLAQPARDIRFKDDPGQRLQHYHVVSVKDDRADTSKIGVLTAGVFGKKEFVVNLEHGAATSISNYIQRNIQQDTASPAADLRITDLQIRQLPGGIRTKIEGTLTIAFFINGTKLTEYKGRSEVQTMGDLFKHIEDLIRQSLCSSLLEFDTWWGKNKLIYASDAPVTLTVEVVRTPKDSSLLGYSAARPLTVNDFMAMPDNLSLAAASTSSSIAVKYFTTSDNGQISVLVLITPYFDKLKSWYLKKHHDNAKVLDHEQRHFDITAIKACELADTMRLLKLTRSNYSEMLELIAVQKQQEMSLLQKQYDAETRHGVQSYTQEKWNKLIADMLMRLGCYR